MSSDEPDPVLAADVLMRQFNDLNLVAFTDHPRPTDGSINRINTHFGIRLPRTLLQLAKHSKNYNAMFLSLGADYTSRSHIIRVNSYWRRRRPKRRIPRHLVIVTHGYTDDLFWCLDVSAPASDGDGYAMQFWCPDELIYPSDDRPVQRYPDFDSYLAGVIKWA